MRFSWTLHLFEVPRTQKMRITLAEVTRTEKTKYGIEVTRTEETKHTLRDKNRKDKARLERTTTRSGVKRK